MANYASIIFGIIDSTWSKEHVLLDSFPTGQVNIEPESVTVNEGDSVAFVCSPNPTSATVVLGFLNDEGNIQVVPAERYLTDVGDDNITFTLLEARREDSGTSFGCDVTGMPMFTSTSRLTVRGKLY